MNIIIVGNIQQKCLNLGALLCKLLKALGHEAELLNFYHSKENDFKALCQAIDFINAACQVKPNTYRFLLAPADLNHQLIKADLINALPKDFCIDFVLGVGTDELLFENKNLLIPLIENESFQLTLDSDQCQNQEQIKKTLKTIRSSPTPLSLGKVAVDLLIDNFDLLLQEEVIIHGRITAHRKMRTSVFADINSLDNRVQLYFNLSKTDEIPNSGDWVKVKGICFRTRLGEASININECEILGAWNHAQGYSSFLSSYKGGTILEAFKPNKYNELLFDALVYDEIRTGLKTLNYTEVVTPCTLTQYNGGNSTPTEIVFNKKVIGYFRTTLEERLKAHLAMGLDQVFQMGPVMRGGNQFVMLEGYSCNHRLQNGLTVITNLITQLAKNVMATFPLNTIKSEIEPLLSSPWLQVDFHDLFEQKTGIVQPEILNSPKLANFLFEEKILDHIAASPESACNKLAKVLCADFNVPVVLNHFPAISSPLYKQITDPKRNVLVCARSKGWLVNGFLFDSGMEENNVDLLTTKLKEQQLRKNDLNKGLEKKKSDIEEVIRGGIPDCFGFGVSISALIKVLKHIQQPFNKTLS